jgi:hypothetical protein
MQIDGADLLGADFLAERPVVGGRDRRHGSA